MTKDLIKEAHDLISELLEKVASLENELGDKDKSVAALKKLNEQEKLASILEEKGNVSYEKIIALRKGEVSDTEFQKLKQLSEVEPLQNFERIEEEKVASNELFEKAINSVEFRKQARAEAAYDALQSIINR